MPKYFSTSKKYVKIFALIRCKITSCIIEQTVWAVVRLCFVVFMPIPLMVFGLNCHEKNGSLLLVVLCLFIADQQIAKKSTMPKFLQKYGILVGHLIRPNFL